MARNKRDKEIQTLTLRVPKDIHEAVRTLAFATNSSINDVALHALRDYLADEGHRQAVESYLRRAQQQYRVALDKLAGM